MRKRLKFIVPGLLVMACVGLLWLRGRQSSVTPQSPAAKSSTIAASHPAIPAATNAVTAKKQNLSASATNWLAFRLSNTTRSVGQLERDRHAILLENAFIDTSAKLDLKIPSKLKAKGDPGAYIVQARGPIDAGFHALITAVGGQVVSYIPNNAYLAQMSAGEAAALQGNPLVQAVVPYEPYYKVQSSLLGLAVNQKPLPQGMYLTLGLYGPTANATMAQIQQLGGRILSEDRSPFGLIVRVFAPQDWIALADLPGVQLVEPAHLKQSANDLSRVTVGESVDTVTNANYLNLSGSNVLVDVNDSGIDALHPDFSATGTAETGASGPTRIFGDFAGSLIDTSGHGTHVAGTIAGNGSMSYSVTNIPQGSVTNADFRGKAPLATLFSVNYGDSDSYLQEEAAKTNALISNNSWVYGDDNAYDLAAASYDAAVRDAIPEQTGPQPVLFVFAAGDGGGGADDGSGGTPDTINSPATAKNVITVGMLEQLRNITNIVTDLNSNSSPIWEPETDSSSEVAAGSARGNVGLQTEGTFGRFKPDVVAPGTFVVSTRSEQWDQQAYFNPTNYHSQTFFDQEVTSNFIAFGGLQVPQNAVGLLIQIFPDALSPVPFPTNMPIFVSSFSEPDPTDPTTYDFETSNNMVVIPPDSGGTINSITNLQNGGISYAISDPTNFPIIFDLFQESITTNDNGNELQVLSNLDMTIGPWYRYETGTSMAAGSVSGVLALMQDFFTNTLHETPSPALLKAMLINGARMTDGNLYSVTNAPNIEGWGQVQLPNSIPVALTNVAAVVTNTPMFFVDQNPTNLLATGDQRTYLVTLPTIAAQLQMLRVTLAWTDPPGNPAAAIKLVNDLELVVTNLSTGEIYYGNNFSSGGALPISAISTSNDVPVFDPINNVKNIALPPLLGSNYSVTVIGQAVNVNAVTTDETNIVQDFALVISSGDGSNTNGISVTPVAPPPTAIVPRVTFLPSTNGIYFNQTAGSSAPWLSTNDLAFGTNSAFATNAVFHIGQTNQWQFYIVTNTFAATNSAYTNAAFIIFLPNTLSLPREGVFANSDANSTRTEADLDLFVSSTGPPGLGDPNASALTNISPMVISNCLFSLNGDAASYGRGGTEFVAYSNSSGNQIYYIGVQAQDQTSGQYGFISIFSAQPFSTLGTNGDEYVTGVNVPLAIPDGNNRYPGVGYVIGLALYPMDIRRTIVTNTFTHQNFGDLEGTISHDDEFAVLNNHDGLGPVFPTLPFVYDDSGQGDITNFPTHSDGPGTLENFVGQEAVGPWLLTEVDDSFTQTGSVDSFNTTIEPHRDASKAPFVTVSIPPNTWYYDYVDVPVGYTNLSVFATNLPPTVQPPIQLTVQEGSPPTLSDTNFTTLLTNCVVGTYPGGSDPGNIVSVGPPLLPGRYYFGLYNASDMTATVLYGYALTFDAAAITTVDWDSTDTPLPLADDAVTDDSIFVTNTDTIQEFKVGLRVDHPRISDLVFTLTDPNNNRYLLVENRGGQSTNGCGITVTQTNIVNVVANGNASSATNSFDVGFYSGTFPITYNFYTAPDEMTVYYGTNITPANLIFDTGLTNNMSLGQGAQNTQPTTITVKFPPPGVAANSTYLTVVMNQFGNNETNGDAWTYTAGGILTNYVYLELTEDTNFTTTPIKFAPPPFIPNILTNSFYYTNFVSMTNFTYTTNFSYSTNITTSNSITYTTNVNYTPTNEMLSLFDAATVGDYTASATVDGWKVMTNEASVIYDPTNAVSGQFLALANASISRTLPITGGTTNTLSYSYRGPGIAGWWRAESNGLDQINGNTGILTNDIGYTTGGEVGSAFAMGTDGFLFMPISQSLNVGPTGFTLEGWVYPTNLTVPNPVFEWSQDGGYSSGLQLYIGSTLPPYPEGCLFASIVKTNNMGGVNFTSAANIVPANAYSHVALTFNIATGTVITYLNGILVQTNNANYVPWTTGNLLLGRRLNAGTPSQNFHFFGRQDEMSVYNRALSASELRAIWSAGTAGKFDPSFSPPQNLAEAQAIVGGVTNTLPLGANTTWQTNVFTFIATNSNPLLVMQGLEPGMLVDSFNLATSLIATNFSTNTIILTNVFYVTNIDIITNPVVSYTTNYLTNVVAGANNLYYLPEQSLSPLIGTSAFGNWQLEVLDNRAGATNPTPNLVSWQLEFEFANTNIPVAPILAGNGPSTNVVGPNSIEWYQVNVPINALAATNSLLFATLPVNFWYSINTPPTITRPNDLELGTNITSGTYIFSSNTVPTLARGTTYYLGVQNTNNIAVTNAVEVDFLLGPTPPILPNIPFQIVPAGFTLVVTNAATDTNAGAVLNYQLVNNPGGAAIDANGTITWPTSTNIAPTNVVFTTIVTDTTTGLSATNMFGVFVETALTPGVPLTNIVAPGTLQWYLVQVPDNALAASNSLLFATSAVNFWYSTNVPPSISNPGDADLLPGSTGGTSVLTTNTTPALLPGGYYFLGVQNLNAIAVTNAVEVMFLLGPGPMTLPFIPTQYIDGGDTLLVTNTATDTNANAAVFYTFLSAPNGAQIDGNGIITWGTTTNIVPTNVVFTTLATDTFNNISATNSFLVEVQVPLGLGSPQTNVVGSNSIEWLVVHVPANALAATNTLLFATSTVNVWYSVNVPQTITNANDVELLANVTSGTSVINGSSNPVLVPGGTYYLGIQNLNSIAVTNAVQVTFEYGPPILPSIPTQIINGGDTLIVTNTAIDLTPGAVLMYNLVNPPAGATIDGNGIITYNSPVVTDITNYTITTIVTDTFTSLSATNSFLVYLLPTLSGSPTNTVPPGGIQWFTVNVPLRAIVASNALLSATSPVNLWFSTNVPPTITNSYDYELLTNATNGLSLITLGSGTPALVPGSTYYLGVQNTNAITVTNAVSVTFKFAAPPTLSITSTNIDGTNGYLLTWSAPTNEQFHLDWTPSLLPVNWQEFKGVISFDSYVTATNSEFSYFDNGTQAGPFGMMRFYRLKLLNSPTNTPPDFVNGTPPNFIINVGDTLTVTNEAIDYDIPAQNLSYVLNTDVAGTNPPAMSSQFVITWTPDIAQGNTTNHFTTIVTDNGVPAKSTTNTFIVIVYGTPTFSSIQVSSAGVNLQWTAPTNDEFDVRWATNLVPPIAWTNFPGPITSTSNTFNYLDTNTPSTMKFYQLLLLP